MRQLVIWVGTIVLLGGCGGPEEVEDTEPPPEAAGACGAVTEHTVRILGAVEQGGAPAQNIDVTLWENAWFAPDKRFANVVTGADGLFDMTAKVTSVEDCWGTALDYVMVATGGGGLTAEKDMNAPLFGAITDGDLEADITGFPIQLP